MTSAAPTRPNAAQTSIDYGAAELWLLAALFGYYGLTWAFFGEDGAAIANRAGPLMLLFVLGFGAWRLSRSDSAAIWTPPFWLRVFTGLYFGFGGLAPYIANDTTFLYMQAIYPFTPADALKLNMLVALGVLCALAAMYAFDWLWPRRRSQDDAFAGLRDSKSLLATGLGFVVVGALFKYLILLPQALGLPTVTIPGAFGNLSTCTLVGVFLLTAWATHHGRYAWPAIVIFIAVELATATITFSKQPVLYTLLMACLGLLTRGVTVARVSVLVVSMVLSYAVLQPLVAHGRQQQLVHLGALSAPASIEQRAAFLLSYLDDAPKGAHSGGRLQNAMSRLSYVNAGTFVIAQYDAGAPGNSFRYALYSFVPRAIWPDKPVTTSIGVELAELATRRRSENSMGAGWFAEAYWNFGWAGVPLLMAPLGVMFAMLSRYAAAVFRRGDWLALPIVFLGLRMGTRVDGAFAVDIVGAGAILIAYMALLALVRLVIPKSEGLAVERRRSAAPGRRFT